MKRRLQALVALPFLLAAPAAFAGSDGYPLAEVDRPLTLPQGTLELEASLGLNHYQFNLGVLGDFSANALGLHLAATYGAIDKLEVGLAVSPFVMTFPEEGDNDTDWGRAIGLGATYSLLDTAMLDVGAFAGFALTFDDDVDVFQGFTLGVPVRLLLMPNLALYSGVYLPIRTSDPSAVDLDIPLGVGLQLNPRLFIGLETTLFSLALSGDGNDSWVVVADYLPIDLRVQYALANNLDVFGTISFGDLLEAGDHWGLGVGAAFRL